MLNTQKLSQIPFKEELIGILLIASSLFLFVALFSYSPSDASWFYISAMPGPTENLCGALGAHVAALCIFLFGGSSLLFASVVLWCGILALLHSMIVYEWERVTAGAVLVVVCATLCHYYQLDILMSTTAGGWVGLTMHQLIFSLCGTFGGALLLHILLLVSLIILLQFSFIGVVHYVVQFLKFVCSRERFLKPAYHYASLIAYYISRPVVWFCTTAKKIYDSSIVTDQGYTVPDFERSLIETAQEVNPKDQVWNELNAATSFATHAVPQDYKAATIMAPSETKEKEKPIVREKKQPKQNISAEQTNDFALPDLKNTFIEVDQQSSDSKLSKELEARARALEEKLERFGVFGEVTSIKRGPVVTLFEYQPRIDTKVSKILALEDDLALALQAMSIRIIAPIPGRAVVGFEVANKQRKDVMFANVIRSQEYTHFKGSLPLILGEDTIGNTVIVDLVKMPHLLIAGSTGSGKSVALNAMLTSLLCKRSPQEMKLILIDPKRLEFAGYADIGHLLFPIITDAKRAVPALRWVVKQMEERYEKMSKCGARTIFDYNLLVGKHELVTESMPFIVVIIDELADLMMTASREIEDLIARIAQMARASGIHMLLATQRPSVDVITGLIKVNFPSRISFRVTSKIDSRTILDCAGADKLLGRGDMLFLDAGGSVLRRVHGAYVLDKEIEEVIKHIRTQQKPEYLDLTEELGNGDRQDLFEADDQLYADITRYLAEIDEVSISLLQRKFRIGFNRSARIIDMLESQGKILPADGSKTRKVIR